jgi:hypothetical protein
MIGSARTMISVLTTVEHPRRPRALLPRDRPLAQSAAVAWLDRMVAACRIDAGLASDDPVSMPARRPAA